MTKLAQSWTLALNIAVSYDEWMVHIRTYMNKWSSSNQGVIPLIEWSSLIWIGGLYLWNHLYISHLKRKCWILIGRAAGNIFYVMFLRATFSLNVTLLSCGPDQHINNRHVTIDSQMWNHLCVYFLNTCTKHAYYFHAKIVSYSAVNQCKTTSQQLCAAIV